MKKYENALKEFFDDEKVFFQQGLLRETDFVQRNNMLWYARQRALGAVIYAKAVGLPTLLAEEMFDNHSAELEAMIHQK